MSNPNKPSFSDTILNMAETAQYALHRFEAGRRLVARFTGSETPEYEQLLWVPFWKRKLINVPLSVWVPGDDGAEARARQWKLLSVIGASDEELNKVMPNDETAVEAVAYRSSKVWHVGVSAIGGTIFSPLNETHSAIAMRQGGGAAMFTLGKYSRQQEVFEGVPRELRRLTFNLPVIRLAEEYPAIKIG